MEARLTLKFPYFQVLFFVLRYIGLIVKNRKPYFKEPFSPTMFSSLTVTSASLATNHKFIVSIQLTCGTEINTVFRLTKNPFKRTCAILGETEFQWVSI